MKNLKIFSYKLIIICGFLLTSFVSEAQVLDLESTTEGVLLPRMTNAQRIAISAPSQSETVYDTETKSFWYWEDYTVGSDHLYMKANTLKALAIPYSN